MTRSLAVSTFVIAALSLAIGTNDAEARHGRRNRCCNHGFANYGYQTTNYGYQNAGVSAGGTGCAPGTWNGSPTSDSNQGQPQNNNTAPPPPTESAPPPAPKT